MENWIAFLGFSGACTVIAFIAGAGFAYGKFTQRIQTIENDVAQALQIAGESKVTAEAAHSLVRESIGRIGAQIDDIKREYVSINQNIQGLRDEIIDIYKGAKK